MAQHVNYWNCSPFADKLRGVEKPISATASEWAKWKRKAEKKHPFRYWLAENFLQKLQDVVTYPIRQVDNVIAYFNNRYISKTHALNASKEHIKPGSWVDMNNRMLFCLFDELVNYVETEVAISVCSMDYNMREKYQAPSWVIGLPRLKKWRCAEAGLEQLEWEASLVNDEESGIQPGDPLYGRPSNQAMAARETLNLYHWWTKEYPKRPDPQVRSGYKAACEEKKKLNGGDLFGEVTTPALDRKMDVSMKNMEKLKERYLNEEDAMLTRLIKLRHSLWT